MPSRTIPLLVAVILGVVALSGAASPARAATNCPASFTVLHNDRVGPLAIPAGPYFLRPTGLSCASASSLLTRFLDDFDGVLPGGWTTAPSGLGFVNTITGARFTLQRAKPPGPGPRCPGTFTVLHNDRIGVLRVRSGRYAITVHRMSCGTASRQFAFFLFHDYAGTLPPGWRLNVAQRRFTRGRSWLSVKFVGRRGHSGGGGVHPNLAVTCPGTVRLAAGTSIGSLVLPAGRYYVNVFSSLSCKASKRQFVKFAAAGGIPASWTLVVETATFLHGNEGFQIEPVT